MSSRVLGLNDGGVRLGIVITAIRRGKDPAPSLCASHIAGCPHKMLVVRLRTQISSVADSHTQDFAEKYINVVFGVYRLIYFSY